MPKKEIRNWKDLDQDGRQRFRFDVVSEVLSTDDETRTAKIRLTPDPRRYTIGTSNGERCYIDKFLKVAIPENIVGEMMLSQLEDVPISFDPPAITSSSEYAESRRAALKKEIDGEAYSPPNEEPCPQKELLADSEASFVSFLSIDIVGSTAQRQTFGEKFDKSYQYFLRELLTSVGHFHGAILNVTGDGFIAYIDMHGFTTQCDNTVDLGLTLLKVLKDSVNPSLEQADLPTLEIRIGADVGKAIKRPIKVEVTNFHSFDIGSAALNRAVKIEQAANAGQLLIGQELYELLHVQWLERCHAVPFNGETVGATDYCVYQVL